MKIRLKRMTQNNEEPKEIGRRLKEEREYRGFSKQEIAEYLGVQKTEIEKIENDEQNIGIDRLEELADFYGLSVNELCNDLENDGPDEEIELLTRSNDDLSETDRAEIHRFAEYLKSRQSRCDTNE